MPIYEYVCHKCGGQLEVMHGMNEPGPKKHEDCGGELERKISAAGFILKGGGWYKDLYASPKPEAKKEAGSEAKAEKKAEPKAAETKPAASATGGGGKKE
jgi:putative FmdB family regulatory protein